LRDLAANTHPMNETPFSPVAAMEAFLLAATVGTVATG